MKPISVNYLTGQMKKVAHISHDNWDSFNMTVFITIISEAAARSLKNIEMFPEAATHTKKYQLHIFFLKQSHIDIFQKQPDVP